MVLFGGEHKGRRRNLFQVNPGAEELERIGTVQLFGEEEIFQVGGMYSLRDACVVGIPEEDAELARLAFGVEFEGGRIDTIKNLNPVLNPLSIQVYSFL